MALMPKRVKHRKSQRGRIRGNATAGNYVAFGDYGIQAMQPGWLSAQQLEAARVVLSRFIGTEARYWCRDTRVRTGYAPARTMHGTEEAETVRSVLATLKQRFNIPGAAR